MEALADLGVGPAARRWRCCPRLNLASRAAAAVVIFWAARSSLAAAIAIFGAWAITSWGIMIILRLARRRAFGGQLFMIIGGAG